MDMSTMTLAEFFALAEKVGGAARTIREAQAMMGAAPQWGPGPVAEHVAPLQASPAFRAMSPAVQWSPAEMAERERLRLEREAAAREAEKAVLESRS